jgi:(p)ppGpp synthase/HD superfamily hydrolase
MTISEKAYIIGRTAHSRQKRRNGESYFVHPSRVAENVDTEEEKAVAYLHDTIEDTGIKAHHLRRAGIPEYIICAVLCLTKKKAEPWEQYIRRVRSNHLARVVKFFDSLDNFRDCKPQKRQEYLDNFIFLSF